MNRSVLHQHMLSFAESRGLDELEEIMDEVRGEWEGQESESGEDFEDDEDTNADDDSDEDEEDY